MNTKPVPIVIILLAAAMTCCVSLVQQVEFSTFLFRLILSVVIFSIIGFTTRYILDFVFNKKIMDHYFVDDEEEKDEDEDEDEDGLSFQNADNIALDEDETSAMAGDDE